MNYAQFNLLPVDICAGDVRSYLPILTAVENGKGVLDVDTVKGCTLGMRSNPDGGCYGECYAYKTAHRYGIDFNNSVSRLPFKWAFNDVFYTVKDHHASWYRIGVAGDPCHDWNNTIDVCEKLKGTGKIPVIITKHWKALTDDQIKKLNDISAVVNTSTSGLDTNAQIKHRVGQIIRLREAGVKSVNRVVTCSYGSSIWALSAKEKQDYLLSILPVIDNPLRTTKLNKRVISGEIIVERHDRAVGGGKIISLHNPQVYLGTCDQCLDQCGVTKMLNSISTETDVAVFKNQINLFDTNQKGSTGFGNEVEFEVMPTIIGSGYEKAIATLAIEDGIAKRAARKNMQIHSAVILKIDGEFCGFMTFQRNHVVGEFCLLQSVIEPKRYTKELYQALVEHVIAANTDNYPAVITTDPKSKFETPKLFENLGFVTYLKMSGFHYMVRGNLADVRMKLLAHITMTNVWNTVKGDWLRIKREWNERINIAGDKAGVENAIYATRGGCWQGENGYSNVVNTKRSIGEDGEIVVTTKAHNGNASVLDPVACEVIARFFMPATGGRIYNPFGGGVQMGYIAGASGYEYVASEIRQNQTEANNLICQEFGSAVKWVQSDSSTYEPEGEFDMVFTCPPYYKVEKYLDYDGKPPEGEINNLPSYEVFRNTLFKGYRNAINRLKDNRFFVVMVGDSRDSKGAYHCCEAETELFLRDEGLSIYNRIVYLECEFTRLAHAKVTLNTRKFPKREQKIIAAYKGDIKEIKDNFGGLGRL